MEKKLYILKERERVQLCDGKSTYKSTIEYIEAYDEPPAGWRKIIGAQTAPHGFEWWFNGESIFGKNYEQALVKKPDAEKVHGVREVNYENRK